MEDDNKQSKIDAELVIRKLLKDKGLKATDLAEKYHNWETQLNQCDTEEKIKEFQQQIQRVIREKETKQNNSSNGLSLPAKIVIGGGIFLFLLILLDTFLKKRTKKNLLCKKNKSSSFS